MKLDNVHITLTFTAYSDTQAMVIYTRMVTEEQMQLFTDIMEGKLEMELPESEKAPE